MDTLFVSWAVMCHMLVPSTLVGIQDRVRGLGLASGCVDFYGSPGKRDPRTMEEQTGVWIPELQEEGCAGR